VSPITSDPVPEAEVNAIKMSLDGMTIAEVKIFVFHFTIVYKTSFLCYARAGKHSASGIVFDGCIRHVNLLLVVYQFSV